jgi:iron complex transport system permease protein
LSDSTSTIKIENAYKKRARRWKLIIAALIAVLIITIIISLNIGYAPISFTEFPAIFGSRIPGLSSYFNQGAFDLSHQSIIVDVRLPRILSALIIGAALAASGTVFQGVFKNPMADPFILGVSAGASVGAGVGILWGAGISFLGFPIVPIAAFISGVVTIFFVYNISRVGSRVPEMTLLLTGLAVYIFLSAVFQTMQILSPHTKLAQLVNWQIGTVSNVGWTAWWSIIPFIVTGIALSYFYARDLNMISLGEDTAQHLGVNTERTKKILLAVSSMMTAAAVSISGLIGFIGLMIPHITRIIIGPDHRVLLPASVIIGSIFLIVCDDLARVISGATEVPVGIITALAGGPFLIFLLRRSKQKYRM